MTSSRAFIYRIAVAGLAGLLLACAGSYASPALAQSPALSRSHEVTTAVTVKEVDRATRHLVVTNAEGDTYRLAVPEGFRSFDTLKPGDAIKATYSLSVEYVISKPGEPLPANTDITLAARSANGEVPKGVLANHMVVTGAVLAIDMEKHTLKMVSPRGGEVINISVDDTAGRKAMAQLKVGDKITAYVTESLLLAVKPA